MNKSRPSERLSRLLAFALSGLFYIAVIALVLFWMRNRPAPQSAFNPAPINLSFAQIELQAAAEPPPEIKPEPPPPEEVDVVIEEVVVQPEPPPPEPPQKVEAPAQVTQEAAAPSAPPIDRNLLLAWVREQIEKEKYYPPAARNAGFEGRFRLLVKIGADGRITGAAVLDGKGHPMLRRSLEKIMTGLIGRGFGQTLPEPVELPFDFEFRLN